MKLSDHLKRLYPETAMGGATLDFSGVRMVERVVCADCGSSNWDDGWCHDACGGATDGERIRYDANAFWRGLQEGAI